MENPVQITVYDLDSTAEYLEGTGTRRDEMTAQCHHCGRTITQNDNVCSDCGCHIVWKYSKIWRRQYGDADRYIRRLSGDLKPITPLQTRVAMEFNNRPEFRTLTEKRKVISIERKRPDDYVLEILDWAKDKGMQAFLDACNKDETYQKWLRRQMEVVDGGMPGDELY